MHFAVCDSFETCDDMLSNSMNSESLNVNFKTNSSRWNPKLKNELMCNIKGPYPGKWHVFVLAPLYLLSV